MTAAGELGRDNKIDISLGNIELNVDILKRQAGRGTKLFAALKANAYNCGLIPVGRIVERAGAFGIAVVAATEGAILRNAGISLPILLYGGTPASADLARMAAHLRLIPTVYDRESAEALAAVKADVEVFVKIDVGLERLGVLPEDAVEFLHWIKALPGLRLGGVYTHFHVPVTYPDFQSYLSLQYKRFQEICDNAVVAGIKIPIRMGSSTATLRQRRDMMLDAIDPGHAIYGINVDEYGIAAIDLPVKPALVSIKTSLLQVRPISRNNFLEAAPFPVRPGMRFGVLPIGLYDSFDRIHAGVVLVRGQRAPILGISSLEHTRVDLTDIPEARKGDEVVILGKQENQSITLQEAMHHNNYARAINYMMAISATIPRQYSNCP